MITCRELADLLIDFSSGDLSPEHREHVEAHLGHCPSCVAYLEGYRLTIEMARELPRPPLPPNLARQLRALLEGRGS
jgi:anti-sigma factor RsiW